MLAGVRVAVNADEVVGFEIVDDVLELGQVHLRRVRFFEVVDDGSEPLNDAVLALDVDGVDDCTLPLVDLVRRCAENVEAADDVGDVLSCCNNTLDRFETVLGSNVPADCLS